MSNSNLPTPDHLRNCPALASIFLLEQAIKTSTYSLAAEHPHICDSDYPKWKIQNLRTSTVIAKTIISLTSPLSSALQEYRRIIIDEVSEAAIDSCDNF